MWSTICTCPELTVAQAHSSLISPACHGLCTSTEMWRLFMTLPRELKFGCQR